MIHDSLRGLNFQTSCFKHSLYKTKYSINHLLIELKIKQNLKCDVPHSSK